MFQIFRSTTHVQSAVALNIARRSLLSFSFLTPIFFSGFVSGAAESKELEPIQCLIEADDQIELSTAVAGIIDVVHVERGDRVEAGQIVAQLDKRAEEVTLQLAQARAEDTSAIASAKLRLDFLSKRSERNQALVKTNAVSQATAHEAQIDAQVAEQSLAEANLEKKLAEIEVQRVQIELDQKTVRSPISGIVTEKLLSAGEYQDGETHVATVAKLDVLRVETFAPLAYYKDVSLGDRAIVRPEPPFSGDFEATITVIDQVFDAATATFGIRLALPNESLELPAGLRCTVTFAAKQ